MQTFKEISFQNYIELKFNTKNLNELAQQQALIKYKRNAQLLAQIFTFDLKKRQQVKSQDCVTQQQLDEMEENIRKQEEANKQKIEEVRQTSKKYEELSNGIKEIKSKQELFTVIDKLKENNLYDESHPYFVADSPFYLSTSEQCYQEVLSGVEPMSEEGLSFYEIN